MHALLEQQLDGVTFTGNIRNDAYALLLHHGCLRIADHVIRVGQEARNLAERFGTDPDAAEIAGYLHDISGIFPNAVRIDVARALGIEVLPEEEAFPLIIHQKISKVMAREMFNITDERTLNAM